MPTYFNEYHIYFIFVIKLTANLEGDKVNVELELHCRPDVLARPNSGKFRRQMKFNQHGLSC